MTKIIKLIFWFIIGWIAWHFFAFWLGRLLGIYLPVFDNGKRHGGW